MNDFTQDSLTEDHYTATSPKRKRNIIIAGTVGLIALAVFFWMFSSPEDATAGLADNSGGAPNVTTRVPGRHMFNQEISATGFIAARREMPVSVVGEGGQVIRVLVEPGEWVKANQPLAIIDRQVQASTVESMEAQLRVSEANLALAEAELTRAQSLVERGFVSQADIDKKTATRDAAEAQMRVAEARLQETRARTERLDVRAPADGLVLTRQVETGQVVRAGSGVLFRLARNGEMEMRAQLADSDLQKMQVGSKAVVTPVGTELQITGEIWQISPVIDPQTRQGMVRIALSYDEALRPGGFADARLIIGSSDAPLLPESAVLNSPSEGDYVYVVGEDNRAVRKSVTIGEVTDDGVTITSGLEGDEQVVLYAGAFLSPGDRVIPVAAPASTAPTSTATGTSATATEETIR